MQFGVPLGAGIPSAASPAVNGATNGVGYPAPPAGPSNFVPPFPAARPAEPAPPPPQPQAPEPYARPLSADAVMNAALAQLISGGTPPAAPDPFARPHAAPDTGDRYHPGPYAQNNSYAQNSYNQNPYAQNPYPQSYAPAEADPATAAFDALAHGLGRSPRPEPQRAYDYHTPAASPAPTALVAQPLLPAVQDYHPQAVRTLEDAVAEMLKPLLQKWLSDNMPRIIERALRVEAASGMKPPGSQ
jgi:cell pole-organizing protein PopZ